MNKLKSLKLLPIIFIIILFLINAKILVAQIPTIFAPGVISGPAHDASPAFAPDGKTVYFSRGGAILVSHLKKGKWSSPEIAFFSGKWSDIEPSMSPDGSFLIFISNRPADGKDKPIDGFFNGQEQPGRGGNLWRIDLIGSKRSEPVRLPDNVNRSNSIYAPSVVADGSVYFMETSGEKRKFRIFRAQFAEGVYQAPEPVSFSTGEASDVDPAVSPDESFAVFSSSRPPAQSNDLFIVFRRNGAWGEPVHMGTDVNSPGSETEARLSPDGETVYFSSPRTMPVVFPRTIDSAKRDLERITEWDNGNNNIWQFRLSEWLEKHKNK